ncbi:MAG TPA: flagellar filament capping protein FliD [Phycisphaerae bacterium]|jgi:flagellar capping protein FliD|nr:flagellar filament capping protein FliD [Phycisphaerae bacterium]HOB73607.1 flagellar filament capping protein FliD [Phycisphaerae bacterium]HOJ54788.1 flagellar filament capping protein FliD [Phycisphaerae bacterium]HOL25860.1 flagellar filament capping protein FliD [Phycisphaerae bacterium]HPP21208.1 flagellar filament capping protein FliD [Phycisphaerae bacterium]
MGTISSSIGLISGMDIQGVVEQLMAIEARPLNLVKSQIEAVKKQQVAYTELSARLMAALGAVRRLAQPGAFSVRTASSSDESVLTATANEFTPPGVYTFQVRSLASAHQLVSTGFVDRDRTPLSAGTLTFKTGKARVDTSTPLAVLNGVQGVRRGVIRITDAAGGSADVDLTAAVTIDDVIKAINTQTTANVRARIDGERLVLTDVSGAAGVMAVQDLGGGNTAADLGIAGTSGTGELVGRDLVQLVAGTRLSLLNDGLGIRTAGLGDDMRFTLSDGRQFTVSLSSNLQLASSDPPKGGTPLALLNDGRGVNLGTIRITNHNGQSAEISLENATTITDVVKAINDSGLGVTVSIAGSKLVVSDVSQGKVSNLKIEDVTGSAAADLGILADTADATVTSGSLYRVDTVGAVLRAIQYAEGNNGGLIAAISSDGNGIELIDTTGSGGFTVEALNDSLAARDLGILGSSTGNRMEGRALMAGLNTVLLSSLNGGSGVNVGRVEFTRRDGSTVEVDFTGAATLAEVIDRINSARDANGQPALSASIDEGGIGIVITDLAVGSGTLSARDISGTTAADLHWTSAAADRLASGDLKRQYISENTLLSELHQGKGIQFGTFRITAANGATGTVTLSESSQRTVGDVLKAINALNMNVVARINADGDGIELVDNTGGGGGLKVTEEGNGGTAASLGLAGQAQIGSNVITGSFTGTITISPGDTLDKLVQKINDANVGVTARVINDGSPFAPYRLVISSNLSGKQGEIAYSTGTTGLSLGTMTVARDAVVAVTDGNTLNPIVISSSTNSVSGVIDGLTLNLTAVSSRPVSVTVEQDLEAIIADVKTFVNAFNDTIDRIGELTKYVPETQEKGILLGDHTVRRLRDQLYNEVTRVVRADGLKYKSLSQLGVSISSGARLTLDEDKLRKVLETDAAAVQKFFTLVTKDSNDKPVNQGIAVHLRQTLEDITSSSTGLLTMQTNALQERVDLYTKRVSDLQALLDKKEARLYAQFQAMEASLAKLQSQQSALSALSSQLAALSPQGSSR